MKIRGCFYGAQQSKDYGGRSEVVIGIRWNGMARFAE